MYIEGQENAIYSNSTLYGLHNHMQIMHNGFAGHAEVA